MRVLLTGPDGFIGSHVARALTSQAHEVVGLTRRAITSSPERPYRPIAGDLAAMDEIAEGLRKCDAVVHLAARAHVRSDDPTEALGLFREANRDATLRLARLAARLGLRHFVFMSSIGVNGERTLEGKPFSTTSPASPVRPYAVAKYEAELGLAEIGRETGMGITILRSPLVYGVGAPGNMRRLLKLASSGWA